ncbi:TetR/AcrR family transcriptional regulator [Corticibacter populi]|uniref:TetR/AcrR family transcriptional regulator n=1 Tax=Corticibacter populi TaxID=1550736 RepID=UPI0010EBBF49|nr:TetR/AcrR family transcriptional regulator [Corticibacter populi]RZS33570.1 TetR family transcriptional regulator [Corticibacter populi]
MINKNSQPRRRGRPPSFDRGTVLERAMLAFWKLGYEGASIADLTAAMGITAQSLYAAFGSKSALYHEVLEHYQQTTGAFSARALEEEPGAIAGFARLLRESAAQFCRADRPRGCMVSTAVLACAAENQEQVRYAAQLREAAIAAFRHRIDRAIDTGEFRPTTDSAALARYLGAIIQGMSIQAQDGATEPELRGIAERAIETLRPFAAPIGGSA